MINPDELPPDTSLPDTQRLKDTGRSGASDVPEYDPESRELGYILDEPEDEKVAKHVHELRDNDEPFMSYNRAIWKRNGWWRDGKRWVRLEKVENRQMWESKLPKGMANAPPVPNKTDRLCRRIVNVIYVDPPYPECEPGDDTPEAREAAEFATQYLSVLGSPSSLNMEAIGRAALDKSMGFASAFGWVIMDPQGAGHRPRSMMAHPEAEHEDGALLDGQGTAADMNSLTERYIRQDGYLTDNPNEADYQWLPRPKVRLLSGNKVNFLPSTATSMKDTEGVLITDHTTLGELRSLFPDEIEALSDEAMQDLCSWKPDKYKDLLPQNSPELKDQKEEGVDGKTVWKDSQVVWTLTVYYRCCGAYPMGCYAIIAGKKQALHREKWTAMMPQPAAEDGTEKPPLETCLEIPLAQQRCLDDNTNDNPYGVAVAGHLGPADEIRASSLGYQLEYMFRFGNPNPMFPMGTIVQPKQWLKRDGNPIYFNPQGKPEIEAVPQMPAVVPALREEMAAEMDDESGLQQTGQGDESPTVKSGIHARVIVQEALKAISNVKANAGFFYIDLNRIILEQTRAFCSVPTLLSWKGKDGEYKAKEFSRTDFRNTKVVSIARGSFTMHTLIAKQEMANDMRANHAIDDDDYIELMAGGISPILGMQENPHLLRVRRQIDKYEGGPEKFFPGWMEAWQANQQATQIAQEVAQGNAEGAQASAATQLPYQAQMAPPIPPPPPGPFDDQLPIDDEPQAAKIRHRNLSRTMAKSKWENFPQPWRDVLMKEYMKAKNAAGVVTVPETQALQAAQQKQAQIQAEEARARISIKAGPEEGAAAIESTAAGARAAVAGQSPDVGQEPGGDGAAGRNGGAKSEGGAGQQIHIHVNHPSGNKDVTYVRDGEGRVVGHQIKDRAAEPDPAGAPV